MTIVGVVQDIEEREPEWDWGGIWLSARLRSLTNETRSFCWKMLHRLLVTGARAAHIKKTVGATCQHCDEPVSDDIRSHTFTGCPQSREAARYLTEVLDTLCEEVTIDQMIHLQMACVRATDEEVAVRTCAEGLAFVWARRKHKVRVGKRETKAHLMMYARNLTRTRHWRTGDRVRDVLENSETGNGGA